MEGTTQSVNTQIINNKTIDYLPIADINVLGLQIPALIDSGASISLLENSIFNEIKHSQEIKPADSNVIVKSISGDALSISGACIIPIQIGNKQIQHKFYIVQSNLATQYKMIIGYDLLKAHHFTICFETDKLISGNSVLRIRDANSTIQSPQTPVQYAKLKRKLILLPHEMQEATLKINLPLKNGDHVLFKPKANNSNIEFSQTVCTVNAKREISVNISNLSDTTIPFNKDTRLGVVSPFLEKRDMKKIQKLRREELTESDFKLDHLDRTKRDELLKLLFEFADIFSKRLYTIGRTQAITPNLQIDKSNLPSTRPYPVPHSLQNELKRQLQELEAADLIEPSDSHISSPLLMVKKKNLTGDPAQQRYRLVTDLRTVNKHLKYPRYNLPIINHLLEKLRGSNYFCSLDLSSSFWQIPLKPEDREITSFNTIFGSYHYKVLPQGLNAASETFSQLSDKILAPISELNISNYIDDFCIGSDNFEHMLFKLRKLFERFREFGLTLNPDKCSFLLKEVDFLGHKLNSEGIRPIDENIKKIINFPIPNTARKIRRFCGLIGYYRRFISHFSKITAPLTNLTRKRQKFKWTPEAQESFDILKQKLSEPPILIHPDFNKQFILSTDSSDVALGGMLGQEDHLGIIHPIAYFSKKLDNAQLRYTIMEKELLAVVEAIKSFKYYLYGRHFMIRCDNEAVTKLTNLESKCNRVTRWFAFLSDYNYTFDLVKSEDNQFADILSRDFYINNIQIHLPTLDEIKESQRTDSNLAEIINKIENDPDARLSNNYYMRDGLLMHTAHLLRSGKQKPIQQIVIPNKYKSHILTAKHLPHFGFLKTYNAIRELYFWENLYSDTKNFVASCKQCMAFKSPNKFPPVPIQRHHIPSRPMEYLSCDFIGRIPTTNKGNRFILTIFDHFTKYIKLYATPNQTANVAAEKLLDFISAFGVPEFLLSDRGSAFTADMFTILCKRFGVNKLKTTALHPSSNGGSERLNVGIKKSLSIFAQETDQWDEYVDYYAMLYNSSYHTAIQDRPAFLHLGYDPLLPTDILNEPSTTTAPTYADYVAKKTYQLQYTFDRIKHLLVKNAETQEKYQHQRAKPRNFYEGQLVYVYSPDSDRNSNLPKKRSYIGPMRIVKIHTPVNVSIIDPINTKAKEQRVHVERLIPYTERKQELDYLTQLVRENHATCPTSYQPDILKKPPAVFDDMTDADILQTLVLYPQQTGTELSNSPPLQATGDESLCPIPPDIHTTSPASSDTEIYELEAQSSPEPQSTEEIQPSHSYFLRSSVNNDTHQPNAAQRLLDWSLALTETKEESTPAPIKFLQKLSDALN